MLRSYQVWLSASVATPSWTMRLPDQILRLGLAALFLPEPDQRRLVGAHDDPGVRSADELTAVRLYRTRNRDEIVQGEFHGMLLACRATRVVRLQSVTYMMRYNIYIR